MNSTLIADGFALWVIWSWPRPVTVLDSRVNAVRRAFELAASGASISAFARAGTDERYGAEEIRPAWTELGLLSGPIQR